MTEIAKKQPRLVYLGRPRARVLVGNRIKVAEIKGQLLKRMSEGICIFDVNKVGSSRERTYLGTINSAFIDRTPELQNMDIMQSLVADAGKMLRKVQQYLPVGPADAGRLAELCETAVKQAKREKKITVGRSDKHNENEVVFFDIRAKRLETVNILSIVRIWTL